MNKLDYKDLEQALQRYLNDAEKWACCGEPEARIRAEFRVKQLERFIANNCDPADMTSEDANIWHEIHRRVHPENY